jgi:hypothetical protein
VIRAVGADVVAATGHGTFGPATGRIAERLVPRGARTGSGG